MKKGSSRTPRAELFCLTSAFLLAFFLYVWLRVDPAIQLHSTGTVFIFDDSFLSGFLRKAGGPVEYAAAFLAQFNRVSWLGAVVLTSAAAGIVGAWGGVLRHVLDLPDRGPGRDAQAARALKATEPAREPGSSRKAWPEQSLAPVLLAPAMLLLLLANRYDYFAWPTCLELLLALGSAVGYLSLPRRSGWHRVLGFLIATPLLDYVGGVSACWLFSSLVVGVELLICRNWGAGVVFVIVAAVTPLVASLLLDGGAFVGLHRWRNGLPMVLTVCLYLFFPLAVVTLSGLARFVAGRISHFEGRPKTLRSARRTLCRDFGRIQGCATLVLIVATFGLALLTFDANRKGVIQVDYFAQQKDWEGVLRAVRQVRELDVSSRLHQNRALFHTGRLASDMFAYRQARDVPLLPGLDAGLAACRAISDTLLELGQVNLAEHFAHEALENEGNRPETLAQLARINVLKARPQAARVFLNLLRKMPFQRRQAELWLRELQADPQWSQHEEVSRIRPCMVASDDTASHFAPEVLLRQLLEANPRNRMAFEYLMAHYLLNGEVALVVRGLDYLNVLGYSAVPRHCQEALLLHRQLEGGERVDLPGRAISPETALRFERFQAQLSPFRDRPAEARMALRAEFGDTYWYYYFLGRAHDRQPSGSGAQR